ncbi:hypothetical protein GCM10009760_50700 [Kitasatospora kazusensis]|uniref:Tetracycline repressor TetR C-terminal domain-containing protein n=1 Tax=Kitasatospora kazusensis TaxID=407974 RepID=A0ABN3A3J5_9ACTN
MIDPANPSRLPATRTHWALVHPLLAALSEAGVPMRAGDLDQLQQAAALGPEFVHAVARWIHAAHATGGPVPAAAPGTVAPAPAPPGPVTAAPEHRHLRQIGPRPTAPALAAGPTERGRQAS